MRWWFVAMGLCLGITTGLLAGLRQSADPPSYSIIEQHYYDLPRPILIQQTSDGKVQRRILQGEIRSVALDNYYLNGQALLLLYDNRQPALLQPDTTLQPLNLSFDTDKLTPSPDKQWLLVNTRTQLYLLGVTGELSPLFDSIDTQFITDTAWSPDAQWIYYINRENGLHRVNVETHEQQTLAGNLNVRYFIIADDWIAFDQLTDRSNPLMVMRLDGSKLQSVPIDGDTYNFDTVISWHPSGYFVVYYDVRNYLLLPFEGGEPVWFVGGNPDDRVQVFPQASAEQLLYTVNAIPPWTRSDLSWVDLKTFAQTPLAPSSQGNFPPLWQDEKLYFVGTFDGSTRLYAGTEAGYEMLVTLTGAIAEQAFLKATPTQGQVLVQYCTGYPACHYAIYDSRLDKIILQRSSHGLPLIGFLPWDNKNWNPASLTLLAGLLVTLGLTDLIFHRRFTSLKGRRKEGKGPAHTLGSRPQHRA